MDIEEAFRGFSIAVDLGTRLQQALLRRQPPQYPQRSRRELKGRVKTPRSNPASRQAWEPFSIQRVNRVGRGPRNEASRSGAVRDRDRER
uniref:Uncharacterized protein n=1 Tax=Vespula pensylvanica TaxID=30213 RepID=A0A834PBA4_VESPE|nr:hypothetical protein H0235_002994 [Vespula pensylvanica]